jgi:hypothetical protein
MPKSEGNAEVGLKESLHSPTLHPAVVSAIKGMVLNS